MGTSLLQMAETPPSRGGLAHGSPPEPQGGGMSAAARQRLMQKMAVLKMRQRFAAPQPDALTPSGSGSRYNHLYAALGPGLHNGA